MKECPFCWEAIQERAVKCKYCKKYLDDLEIGSKKVSEETDEQKSFWIVWSISVVILIIILFIFCAR